MGNLTKRCHKTLYIDYPIVREALAEFIGTAFLVTLGDGSVAQKVLSRSDAGNVVTVYLSWGFAVTFGVYISGGVTGGHINPAISLTMCLLGRLPWYKLPVYMIAQYAGGMFGAALVYAVYYNALNAYDGGTRQVTGPNETASIFATYPQDFLTTGGGMGDQIVGTMILSLSILAITDKRNMGVRQDLIPVLVGLVVVLIGSTYGFNCGYAINPARDLGPRMFTAAAGWGVEVFSYRNYQWFWVPILGPHVGAILGAFTYQLAIGLHWPDCLRDGTPSSRNRRSISSNHDTSRDVNSSLGNVEVNDNINYTPA